MIEGDVSRDMLDSLGRLPGRTWSPDRYSVKGDDGFSSDLGECRHRPLRAVVGRLSVVANRRTWV